MKLNFRLIALSVVLTFTHCMQAMENVAPVVLTYATPVMAGIAGYMAYQHNKKAQLLNPEYSCEKDIDISSFGAIIAGVGFVMRAGLFVYPYDPNNRFTMMSSAVPAAVTAVGCGMQYCMNSHTSNLLALQNQNKRAVDNLSQVIEKS
jgi:hypothetical protein